MVSAGVWATVAVASSLCGVVWSVSTVAGVDEAGAGVEVGLGHRVGGACRSTSRRRRGCCRRRRQPLTRVGPVVANGSYDRVGQGDVAGVGHDVACRLMRRPERWP